MDGDSDSETTTKKLENVGSRDATICEMRNELFKEARELAVTYDAQVGVITISNDGTIHEFATSSMQSIIERYRKGKQTIEQGSSKSKLVNQEADKTMPEEIIAEKPKSNQNFLGKDFACMKFDDLVMLEEQLHIGIVCILQRENELLVEELEQLRTWEQQILQENQILEREIEELQGDRASYNSQDGASTITSDSSASSETTLPSTSSDLNL